MRKKIAIITVLFIVVSLLIVNLVNSTPVSALTPYKLKIYIGPNNVPADNNAYEVVFVQLQDNSNKPVRALEDT